MTNDQFSRLDSDETEALHALGWQPAPEDARCPDSALLIAAEDGILDAAVAARVREHLLTCSTCRLLASDLASVFAANPTEAETTAIRSRVAAGAMSTRHAGSKWLGFGGLLVAAGLAGILLWPRSEVPPATETPITKEAPPALPSVFVLSRPVIPPADVELNVRGESPVENVAIGIAAALDTADRGDLSSASVQLGQLVRRNPRSRSAALAIGSVQLRAGQNTEAVASLERARKLETDPELDDEIDWFLSIALVRTGNRDRARPLLEGVCRRGGSRSAGACAGVAEIDRQSAPR